MKRLLSFVLAMAMLLSMVPAAFAVESESGTLSEIDANTITEENSGESAADESETSEASEQSAEKAESEQTEGSEEPVQSEETAEPEGSTEAEETTEPKAAEEPEQMAESEEPVDESAVPAVIAEEEEAETQVYEPAVAVTEIDEDTLWAYLDDNTDPAGDASDRLVWTAEDYDDSNWKTGAGAFGSQKGSLTVNG